MAIIALEGMHFFAFHGYYDEEQKMGGDFILDVYITADVKLAAAKDDLEGTVNYEMVYFICKSEMKKTSRMIETVAQRILDRLCNLLSEKAKGVKVRLRKMNPPLGGKVHSAYVELEAEIKGSQSA
jgi:dihydroneopterin aldolase